MRSNRRRPPLRKRLWARVRRMLGGSPPPSGPPPDRGDEEPALVPVGPPKRPRPSSAVALEEPDEPDDVDAYGSRSSAG